MNTDKYKKLLEIENDRLTKELSELAERDPANPGNWIPTPPPDITHEADPIDQADAIEEYGDRISVEVPIEERYKQVQAALEAIKQGTYGMCLVGGAAHAIEEGRLEANPAATTCIAHMNS